MSARATLAGLQEIRSTAFKRELRFCSCAGKKLESWQCRHWSYSDMLWAHIVMRPGNIYIIWARVRAQHYIKSILEVYWITKNEGDLHEDISEGSVEGQLSRMCRTPLCRNGGQLWQREVSPQRQVWAPLRSLALVQDSGHQWLGKRHFHSIQES